MGELALRPSEARAVGHASETASCGILPKRLRGIREVDLHGANESGAGGRSCHLAEVNMTNLDPQETFYGKDSVLSKKGLHTLFFKNEPLD